MTNVTINSLPITATTVSSSDWMIVDQFNGVDYTTKKLSPSVLKTFIAPLTTKGDLLAYSTTNTRLPVGTNGQFLTSDSSSLTGLKWTGSFVNNAVGFTLSGGTTSKLITVSQDCYINQNLQTIADVNFSSLTLTTNASEQLILKDANSTNDRDSILKYIDADDALYIQAYDHTSEEGQTIILNKNGGQVTIGDSLGALMLTSFNVFGNMATISEDNNVQIVFTDRTGLTNGDIGVISYFSDEDGPFFQGYNFLTNVALNTYVSPIGGNVGLGRTGDGGFAADFPIHMHGLTVIGTFDNSYTQLVLKDENNALKSLDLGYNNVADTGRIQAYSNNSLFTAATLEINPEGGFVGINSSTLITLQSPLTINGDLFFSNIETPSTPTNGGKLYSKLVSGNSDLYFLDSDGTEHQLTASGSSPVLSVFGRMGVVTAMSGDYTAAQVINAADKSSVSIQNFSGILQTPGANITSNIFLTNITTPPTPVGGGRLYSKLVSGNSDLYFLDSAGTEHQLTAIGVSPVLSVFGRTGVITAVNTDYATVSNFQSKGFYALSASNPNMRLELSADGVDETSIIQSNLFGSGVAELRLNPVGNSVSVNLPVGQYSQSPFHLIGDVFLSNVTTPATPTGGGKLYTKSDKNLYFLNSDGTETNITSGNIGGAGWFKFSPSVGLYSLRADDWAAPNPISGIRLDWALGSFTQDIQVDGTDGNLYVTNTSGVSRNITGTTSVVVTSNYTNTGDEDLILVGSLSGDITITIDATKLLKQVTIKMPLTLTGNVSVVAASGQSIETNATVEFPVNGYGEITLIRAIGSNDISIVSGNSGKLGPNGYDVTFGATGLTTVRCLSQFLPIFFSSGTLAQLVVNLPYTFPVVATSFQVTPSMPGITAKNVCVSISDFNSGQVTLELYNPIPTVGGIPADTLQFFITAIGY